MNEKVSISDINIPNNFKDIKTNYKITLYDKDTGDIVYSTDGHNKLNPNLGLRPWVLTYGGSLTSAMQLPWSNNKAYEPPLGLYFYNSPDDPSTNHLAGPQRGSIIGGGQIGASNSAANRCSYNPTESKYEIVYEEGIAYMHRHMVFDATTSQLNGEINTVVIGSPRYLSTKGVFEAGFTVTTPNDYTVTPSEYNQPIYAKNASLMSHHPDYPSWAEVRTTDACHGTWSFESDNTAWFSPYRNGKLQNINDIVLFHYDLLSWKVLGTITLSLPQECIGKDLFTFKFKDCIGVYPYSSSYSETSSGDTRFDSTSSYIFNLNGDYVKSISRSVGGLGSNRAVAIDNKLYYWPSVSSNNTYRGLLVLDAEMNMLSGFRMCDYMDDSRIGTHSTQGKYVNSARPIVVLDNITGERRLLICAASTGSKSIVGDTNLSWNINTGQVEWLPTNSIYTHCYSFEIFGNVNYVPCIVNGVPHVLPTHGYANNYWPYIWHHWCKLPSSVTKTANTTMKIQIDLYYPIVCPFAFAAPPDGQASTTESE